MLKDRRMNAGMSQTQLAAASGVNVRMIQKYEQGSNDLNKASGETLLKLAQALGCHMEDLMDVKEER